MKRWITRTLVGAFGASLLIGGLSACGHGHHGGWQMTDDYAPKMPKKCRRRSKSDPSSVQLPGCAPKLLLMSNVSHHNRAPLALVALWSLAV